VPWGESGVQQVLSWLGLYGGMSCAVRALRVPNPHPRACMLPTQSQSQSQSQSITRTTCTERRAYNGLTAPGHQLYFIVRCSGRRGSLNVDRPLLDPNPNRATCNSLWPSAGAILRQRAHVSCVCPFARVFHFRPLALDKVYGHVLNMSAQI
jgi:hypothetical protein